MIDFTKNQMDMLIEINKKYGKRGKESLWAWVHRRRTLNTVSMVLSNIKDIEFHEYEAALYCDSEDNEVRKFIRYYEIQMEEAFLHPDIFLENLNSFYIRIADQLKTSRGYSDFFRFFDFINSKCDKKIMQGYKKIYNVYISLLMEQIGYFDTQGKDESFVGIHSNGTPIFKKSQYAYFDVPSYNLEKYMVRGKDITKKQISKAYQEYGYSISSWEELKLETNRMKVYDNNRYNMIPYIDEHTLDMIVEHPYLQYELELPRKWKSTEFYLEKLQQRKYMLPVSGIIAKFVNAGDLLQIKFKEICKNNAIILLYHVLTKENGEYAGFFNTKTQYFYTIFNHTNWNILHEGSMNFILENYMILTCDYVVDRKKNFAIKVSRSIDTEFHFPYQPLAEYTYSSQQSEKDSCRRKVKRRYYSKETYKEELRSRTGYIRNLPKDQTASDTARCYAREWGYDLPPGKTFVRTHDFHVYCKQTEGGARDSLA